MKVKLHMLAVDASVAERQAGIRPVQGWQTWNPGEADLPLLDGPVNPRLAVLDFDPESGALVPGARLAAPKSKRGFWTYDFSEPGSAGKPDADKLRQVSVFSTVLRTLALFESPDALGRRIAWAFDGEQLLIVPRAGEWANAFYDRDSRSLQFFFFTSSRRPGVTVHTSASPDIVAHEAAHAILDGIAPDLYDSVSPQALAVHEAVADLTAAFFAFEMDDQRLHILKRTGGRLDQANEFGWIAEEFGTELAADSGDTYLRNLYSDASLDPRSPRSVGSHEPHDLSVVLSGAIFGAFVEEFERDKAERSRTTGKTPYSVSGQSLWVVAGKLRRILFRALDYLPPGDVSFADLARAMLATDASAFPDKEYQPVRDALEKHFKKRGIVRRASELAPIRLKGASPFAEVDLDRLLTSDWYAYQLMSQHRGFFRLPADEPVEVRPRLRTEKTYYRGGQKQIEAELVMKLSWSDREANAAIPGLPAERRVRRGTTVVADWKSKEVRLLLTTNPDRLPSGAEAERRLSEERDRLLLSLWRSGRLAPDARMDPQTARRLGLAAVQDDGGVMTVKGLGRFLHLWESQP